MVKLKKISQLCEFSEVNMSGSTLRFQKAYLNKHCYTKYLESEDVARMLHSAHLITPHVGSWCNDVLMNVTPFLCSVIIDMQLLFALDSYIMLPSQQVASIGKGSFKAALNHLSKAKLGGRNVWEYNRVLAPGNIPGTFHWFLLHAIKVNGAWKVEMINTLIACADSAAVDDFGLKFTSFLITEGIGPVDATEAHNSWKGVRPATHVPQQTDGYICGYAVMALMLEHLGLREGPLTPGLLHDGPSCPLWGNQAPDPKKILSTLVGAFLFSNWEPMIVTT